MNEPISLQSFNTFGLKANARHIETAKNTDELCRYWQNAQDQKTAYSYFRRREQCFIH